MNLRDFVDESNRIEGITREPTDAELTATDEFLCLGHVRAVDLARLVQVYQPGAELRLRPGMDVRVGRHVPPPGGATVAHALENLLARIGAGEIDPHAAHKEYEDLHPFTDGNGRSGRALWLWHMLKMGRRTDLGFLHAWYYQSLEANR